MLETKDIAFHWFTIFVAILLGALLVPKSVHAGEILDSKAGDGDVEAGKFLIENKDEVNTKDGHGRPSVLVRYIHSIDGSSAMGILMNNDMQKATERLKGSIRDELILSSACQITYKEEYGSSEFGNWEVDPAVFDFVVTNTREGYTRAREFFEFNQPIQFSETWEVKKGLDATISKKLRTSFEFLVDVGLTFEQEDFQESVPVLLTTVVAPRRGPILKEICGFIQEHFTPNPRS